MRTPPILSVHNTDTPQKIVWIDAIGPRVSGEGAGGLGVYSESNARFVKLEFLLNPESGDLPSARTKSTLRRSLYRGL